VGRCAGPPRRSQKRRDQAKGRESARAAWADPLKAWGDVLVKQGKIKDALTKYDEALTYAPNWKQLQDAREAAAKATR